MVRKAWPGCAYCAMHLAQTLRQGGFSSWKTRAAPHLHGQGDVPVMRDGLQVASNSFCDLDFSESLFATQVPEGRREEAKGGTRRCRDTAFARCVWNGHWVRRGRGGLVSWRLRARRLGDSAAWRLVGSPAQWAVGETTEPESRRSARSDHQTQPAAASSTFPSELALLNEMRTMAGAPRALGPFSAESAS